MDPIKVDFTGRNGKGGPKATMIPPEKAGLKIVINILLTIIVAFIAYYLLLPPMNFKVIEFYIYFAVVFGAYILSSVLTTRVMLKPEYVPYVKKQATIPIILLVVLGVILGTGYISSAVLFRAKAYSRIIEVEDTDIDNSVTVIRDLDAFKNVPLIDIVAAERLADKTLGDLYAQVSQFEVDNFYSTQINYKDYPYRVFPLKYGDVFKWFNNRSEGLPGYITVNMNTQRADYVPIDEGIKYSPSEHFSRYLMRHLRFNYPTYIFGTPSFEIDEEGNPYWIAERIDKKVGLIGGDDVVGAVFVDAVSGECNYYDLDEIRAGISTEGTNLSWIDQIFSADLLVRQFNYFGRFSGGFFNSIIGQTGVKSTTNGYNYIAIEDDVYMYTGVTSVSTDQSIVGFAMINQRTKDAFFYQTTGATENAAQASAEGIVQDKGWKATFPILLNIDSEATYFMALKDANDVIKSYAMVNVEQYQEAVRSPGDDSPDLKAALSAYINRLATRDVIINVDLTGVAPGDQPSDDPDDLIPDVEKYKGAIQEITTAVIGGNSVYYVKLDNDNKYFSFSALEFEDIVIFKQGDYVEIETETIAQGAIVPGDSIAFAVADELETEEVTEDDTQEETEVEEETEAV